MSYKTAAKAILRKAGILEKIRWTDVYQNYRSPGFSKRIEEETNFYASILKKNDLIFDIGGNVGHKTRIYAHLVNKVVVVEPEKENLSILNGRFGKNAKIIIVPCAVGDKEGEQEFFIHEKGSGVNTLSEKWKNILEAPDENRWNSNFKFNNSYIVPVTTIEQLIEINGVPNYIKIDVEGWEKQVIQGLNRPIEFISFECNFPEFKKESIECLEHLKSLSNDYSFNYVVNNKFEFADFLGFDEFADFIAKNDSIRYMEIYGRLQKNS